MRGIAAFAGTVLAVLALGACSGVSDAVSDPFRMSNTELLEAGFKARDPLPPPPSTYCYETLAETMCYREPLPGEAERLVEAYPPRAYLPEDSLK